MAQLLNWPRECMYLNRCVFEARLWPKSQQFVAFEKGSHQKRWNQITVHALDTPRFYQYGQALRNGYSYNRWIALQPCIDSVYGLCVCDYVRFFINSKETALSHAHTQRSVRVQSTFATDQIIWFCTHVSFAVRSLTLSLPLHLPPFSFSLPFFAVFRYNCIIYKNMSCAQITEQMCVHQQQRNGTITTYSKGRTYFTARPYQIHQRNKKKYIAKQTKTNTR